MKFSKKIVAPAMALAIMAGIAAGGVESSINVDAASAPQRAVTYSIVNAYNPSAKQYSLYSYNAAYSADAQYVPDVIEWKTSSTQKSKPVYYSTGSTSGPGYSWEVTKWKKSGWNVTLTTAPTGSSKIYAKTGTKTFQLGIGRKVDVGVTQHTGGADKVTLFVNDFKNGKVNSVKYTMKRDNARSKWTGLNIYSTKVTLTLKDPNGKNKTYTKTMCYLENSKSGKVVKSTGSITTKVLAGTSKVNFEKKGTVDKTIGGYYRTFYMI